MRNIFILVALFILTAVAGAETDLEVSWSVDSTKTIARIAQDNGVPVEKLIKSLQLDLNQGDMTLSEAGRNSAQAGVIIRRIKILQQTEQSKNWKLILFKFGLWTIALAAASWLLVKRKANRGLRLAWMAGTALVFGFLLGSDPNPMGTVKDAVVLWGREGVLFPPRLIALVVFLLMVWISNKSICGWGCHFGALQDLLHHIPVKKFKLPFILTNAVRLAVLLSVIVLVFFWKIDWVGAIDPFKVFNWQAWSLTLAGLLFLAFILILGLFFYRPWCQLFCPFGLLGWMVEQASLLRPRIRREHCRKCLKCVEVCPSQAMDGIYHDKKTRADCFACGKCIEQCPARVINWEKYSSNKEKK
jgi:polyferredoxin